jgi:hypothetical protein
MAKKNQDGSINKLRLSILEGVRNRQSYSKTNRWLQAPSIINVVWMIFGILIFMLAEIAIILKDMNHCPE